MINVLITSAGRRGYLIDYFREVLGNSGLVHATNSVNCPAFAHADRSMITPIIYDNNYIPFLIQYCLDHQISVIIPLFDIDLLILSRNKKAFNEIGVRLIVSDEHVIEICNDKWKTYEYLLQHDVSTPDSYLTVEGALSAVDEGFLKYPLIIKPRWGMGSIGLEVAESDEELRVLYNKVKRVIFSSYLNYESIQDSEKCILIQEKLIGTEYGIDIINDLNGDFQSVIIKEKLSVRAGETFSAIVVKNDKIELLGQFLANHLKHVGNMDVDMIVADGIPYIIELNPRFGGCYPFSHIAGVNLPKAIISWLRGEYVDKYLLQAQTGVVGHKDFHIISNQALMKVSII